MAGGIVTVVGAAGHIVSVTVNGSQAYSLAQLYASAVNTAASSGSFFAASASGDGGAVVPSGGSTVNELVADTGGFYLYPSGYNFFTTGTTDPVFIDAKALSSSAQVSTLVGTGGATYIAGDETGAFIAGGGNNLFMNSGTGQYVVATSDGNDSIFAGSGNTLIDPGLGQNLVRLGAGSDTVNSDGTDSVLASAGSATISLTGVGSTIFGGSGNLLVDDAGVGTTIHGGSGDASIVGTGGSGGYYNLVGNSTVVAGVSDTIAASGNSTVYGSSGTTFDELGSASLLFIGGINGTATVNSGGGDATVFGSAGTNIQYSGHGILVAGSGNETLNGSNSTQGFTGFISNTVSVPGTDSISGGTGADVLVAGMGYQTLGGGSGAGNIFVIAENGTMSSANITISDFGSASGNLVALYGYGASEINNALSTATTAGGNTTITLGDSSKVTFLNVTSLHSTSFLGG